MNEANERRTWTPTCSWSGDPLDENREQAREPQRVGARDSDLGRTAKGMARVVHVLSIRRSVLDEAGKTL